MDRTHATTQRHMEIRHTVLRGYMRDLLLQVMSDREGYQLELDRWWREKQDFDQLEAARTAMLANTAEAHKKQFRPPPIRPHLRLVLSKQEVKKLYEQIEAMEKAQQRKEARAIKEALLHE